MIDRIVCLVKWAVHAIGQTILDVLDFLLSVVIQAVNIAISILPNDPTNTDGDAIGGGVLGTLNYFVPLGVIVGQFGLIMTAWILYRLFQWLLRWAKAEG